MSTGPKFNTRAYNKITHDKVNGVVIKESNTPRFDDEKRYYESLPSNLRSLFPKFQIIEGKLHLDYIAAKPMIIGETPIAEWKRYFRSVFYASRIFYQTRPDSPYEMFLSPENCRAMYLDKTNTEYTAFKNSAVCQPDYLSINGISYRNYHLMQNEIANIVTKELIRLGEKTAIHGDYCVGNILWDGNKVILIDPRGSWGEKGIWGDPLYDIAKLYHSIEGRYEDIVNDRFALTTGNGYVTYNFTHPEYQPVLSALEQAYHIDLNLRLKARLVMGLIFVGMCARHYDSPTRQTVMYATGIKVLNEVINEYRSANGG